MSDDEVAADALTWRDLAIKHGTDKVGLHDYAPTYEPLLAPIRDRPVKLLEIGVGGNADTGVGGNSLRLWKEYFPLGTVVGLDLYDKSIFAEDRIIIEQGDQSDTDVLQSLHDRYGPFDIIIDDGSHISWHIRKTFRALFPLLAPGGIYFIEDLQTSYWPSWGGSLLTRSRWTSMNFLKDRVDGLHSVESRVPRHVVTPLDRDIVEVRFRQNIAAVVKRSQDKLAATYAAPGLRSLGDKRLLQQASNTLGAYLRGRR